MAQPPVIPSPVPAHGWQPQPRPDVPLGSPLRWTALFCALCSTLGVLAVAVVGLVVLGLASTVDGSSSLRDSLGSAPVLAVALGMLAVWLVLTLVAFLASAAFLLLLRLVDGFRRLPGVAQAAITVFGLQSLVGTLATLSSTVTGLW